MRGSLGFKEEKAKKKRRSIVEHGMRLFMKVGFEETSMEAIAAAAELSLSTVYRCFPSKDLIALAAISDDADLMTETFRCAPADLSVEQALASAVIRTLETYDREPGRSELVRSILDRSPNARARLGDFLAEQRSRLGQLLAERLNLEADDMRVIWISRVTCLLAETASDLWRNPQNTDSARSLVSQLMLVVSDTSLPLPRESAAKHVKTTTEHGQG